MVRRRVADQELALLHVAVGRPHRGAARAQHRRGELGVRRAPGESGGRGWAPGAHRPRLWPHLRSLRRRIRISGRGAGRFVGTRGTSDAHSIIEGAAPWRWEPDLQTPKTNPYVQEHRDLIASIRAGRPLNEGRQVAESTLTAIMGREAAYTGQEIG